MARVLVTGASGFIGSRLCGRLSEQGDEIHAISRIREGVADGIRWWALDLGQPQGVERVVAKVAPDVIYHLAGHVSGARALDQVLPAFDGNLLATVNLLSAAAQVRCRRIVLTGSLEEPDFGDASAVPGSPYAASKWAAAAYARMFRALYELPMVTLRVFMAYGPGQKDLQKLIPYVTLALQRGEPPRLTSGVRLVDWIYVDDVVEAYRAAGAAPGLDGETLDIGSGHLVAIRTVVEMLVRLINPAIEPQFGAIPDRPLERVRAADLARTIAGLGWKPTVPLEEGLRRTVAWYAARAGQPV